MFFSKLYFSAYDREMTYFYCHERLKENRLAMLCGYLCHIHVVNILILSVTFVRAKANCEEICKGHDISRQLRTLKKTTQVPTLCLLIN